MSSRVALSTIIMKKLYKVLCYNSKRGKIYFSRCVNYFGTFCSINNYFTYGLEYHRTLILPLGFSFSVENTPNNKEQHHEIETMGLITLSFFKNITLGIGPGIKFEEGNKSKFLGRGAFNYIFKIGSTIEMTPNINYDVVNNGSNEVIYGIKIGKQF